MIGGAVLPGRIPPIMFGRDWLLIPADDVLRERPLLAVCRRLSSPFSRCLNGRFRNKQTLRRHYVTSVASRYSARFGRRYKGPTTGGPFLLDFA